MGLKTTNYEVKDLGITIPTAYARIVNIHSDLEGEASVIFEVQQLRENIGVKEALERKYLSMTIDKNLSSYAQAYTKAKEEIFIGWEDNIVE